MNKQCDIHSKEIDELRRVKHKNTNEISKLKLMHEENLKDIDEIKVDINDIKNNHLTHIEKDIGTMQTDIATTQTDINWLKQSYTKLDKKFWAIVIMSLGTLLGTFINFIT